MKIKLFILGIFLAFFPIFSFAIDWNSSDFLNTNFWSQNPSLSEITDAVFSTQSIYTQNWTGYSSACSISEITTLNPGTDTIPANLNPNTIYVLNDGTYITTRQISMSGCSAVLGNGNVLFQSTGQLTRMILGSGVNNIVLDNLQIDGKTLHTTTPNTYGIEFMGNHSNVTFNNIDSYNNAYGIVLRNGSYYSIYNTKIHDNVTNGLYSTTMYKMNIHNSEMYLNLGAGANDGGLFIYLSSGVILKDVKSYWNRQIGINIYTTTDSNFENIKVYANTGYGIRFSANANRNQILNSELYNNADAIYFYQSSYNLVNNCNIFNNIRGITNGRYVNTITNVNIFNNNQGIYSWASVIDLFDNVNIFNNNQGIFIEDYYVNNIFNNISVYNNNTGINFDYGYNITQAKVSTGNKYYGKLTMFGNTVNMGGIPSRITTGIIASGTTQDGKEFFIASTGDYNGLGFSAGYMNTSHTLDSSWMIDVTNASGQNMLAGLSASKRGQNTGWIATKDITYTYGKNITKQIWPWTRTGANFVRSNVARSPYVYVGKTWNTDEYFTEKEFISGTGVSKFTINSNTMVGNNSIDVAAFSGSILPKQVIFQSTGTNKAEVLINNGTNFKASDGIINYTGTISAPSFVSTGVADEILYKNILSVISVGAGENIQLKDGSGNATNATILMPVIGTSVGKILDVYYSQDQNIWTKFASVPVIDLNGTPYVQFTTTHFTDFAVGEGIGSFVIKNDDLVTNSRNVTLNISMPISISKMRFSNDNTGSRSVWEDYSSTKSWILSENNGTKIVYVEFDVDGDGDKDFDSLDGIFLNGPMEGQISLNILSGESYCTYGTSINLGAKDIPTNFGGLEFVGNFTGSLGTNVRSCTDYAGTTGGRDLTIQSADLRNSTNNIISGTNVMISYDNPVLAGGDCIIGNTGSIDQSIGTVYTMIAKGATPERTVCKIQISNVSMKIAVPANQSPGSYSGLLTITLPNFN